MNDQSPGRRGDRDLARDPPDRLPSNDPSWGQGSASALESLKRREQRRERVMPHPLDDQRPQGERPQAASGFPGCSSDLA